MPRRPWTAERGAGEIDSRLRRSPCGRTRNARASIGRLRRPRFELPTKFVEALQQTSTMVPAGTWIVASFSYQNILMQHNDLFEFAVP